MVACVLLKPLLIVAFAVLAASSPALVSVKVLNGRDVSNSTQNEAAGKPNVASLLRQQMSNPADILSVLLITGGDVIQKAIAQLSGTWPIVTPIPFSFGWVSYTFNAMMSIFGEGILMPRPEDEITVFNVDSGTRKKNESWVLWRLLRDLELKTMSDTKKAGSDRKSSTSGCTGSIQGLENQPPTG